MTRITATMINTSVQQGIQANGVRLNDIMSQIATGKAINQPSDDPVGTSKALRLRSQTSRYDQYYRNMQDGQAWLSTADTALRSGNDSMQRANELAIQGANGTYNALQRDYLKNEVRVLADQILSISSTTLHGQYIFSGNQTDKPPFTLEHGSDTLTNVANANGTSLAAVPATVRLRDTTKTDSATTTGNPAAYDILPGTLSIPGLVEGTDYTVDYRAGEVRFLTAAATNLAGGAGIRMEFDWIRKSEEDMEGQVLREVQQDNTVQVNVTASTAFGDSGKGGTVFDSLVDLMQGLHTNDQGKVQSSMAGLQGSLEQLLKAQTVAGSVANRLQNTQDQNRSDALVVTKQSSEVEEIDFTKVVSAYQNRQTVYDAALRVGAKVIQNSLVNYI
ncbi:MAG TPA: flagellar hook-associated protein FlgL [Fibrobacteria bacterium]|nr:flagellar hook-associated protein FlgL [Fibrobacteria bacterium]